MEFLNYLIDLFLHLDKHLEAVIGSYGDWTYGLLFLIVFMETGVVFTPFLPGDSLLFAAGSLAGKGLLEPFKLWLLLTLAPFLGDNSNYWIGRLVGPWLIRMSKGRLLKQQNLDRTHAFMEKYGPKAIILARFVPIVRTFAPFVAGLGRMSYGRFLLFSIIGAQLWVLICGASGYFFGQIPWVQKNFSVVVLVIVFISILPMVIEYVRHRRAKAMQRASEPQT